ncbi:MAG: hypothetical protein J5J00_16635 [Deltaproteobacteria bacterium]|nr:hypothetical protein [Deltaproteobacteria bacterium]
MKSKIKLRDIPLLVKSDRRWQIAAVVVLLVLIWPFIDPTANNQRIGPPRLQPPPETTGTGRVSEEESAQDIIKAFQKDMEDNRKETTLIRKELQEEIQTRRQTEERTAEIFKRVLERFSELQSGTHTVGGGDIPLGPEDLQQTGSAEPVKLDLEGFESFGPEETASIPLPPPPKREAFVGAGDSVRVKLLSGVNAPTDGTPYPVVFQLVGDVLGPDGSALPLGEARLIAAAQGSLTDSRALFRLTSMNVRLPNGRRKVVEVDGWIVGEDGIRGMSGILIDPIGAAIAGGVMTGTLAGIGEGIAANNTTVTSNVYGGTTSYVSGDIASYAAGTGISRGAETWEEIIKERLNLLVPVVQVLSNREATAVFAKNVIVPDLYDALGDEDSLSDSLD